MGLKRWLAIDGVCPGGGLPSVDKRLIGSGNSCCKHGLSLGALKRCTPEALIDKIYRVLNITTATPP